MLELNYKKLYKALDYNKIGALKHNELLEYINTMETDITEHEKTYTIEFFSLIHNFLITEKENAKTFKEFKEIEQYTDKLEWLKFKNFNIEYAKRENEIYNKLRKSIPTHLINTLNELIDMQTEREIMLYSKS